MFACVQRAGEAVRHAATARSFEASRRFAAKAFVAENSGSQSVRCFSSLPRPASMGPPSGRGPTGMPRPKVERLRKHAVALNTEDYTDPRGRFERAPAQTANRADETQAEEAQKVLREEKEQEAKKQRWLENAKKPARVPVIDERGRAYGRGGRKSASARVWIQPGFGNVTVNRKDLVDYFARASDREHLLAPLAATRTCGKFDVAAYVQGGGLRGQAGAIRHGLARAMNAYNPDEYRPALKYLGYLTRDARKVERKKIGHVKARKKPQWVKR